MFSKIIKISNIYKYKKLNSGEKAGDKYYKTIKNLGPIVYWRLGESTGTVAVDQGNNGNDGTYSSVSLGATGCLLNSSDTAVDFTASNNSQVQKTSAVGLPTATNATWTLSLWHRTSALVSLSAYLTFGDSPTSGFAASGKRSLLCYLGNYYFWGEGRDWNTGVAFHADSTNHFVVFTSDGTNLRLYIDGLLAAGPQAIPYSASSGTTITVGSHHPAGSSPDAVIDECVILDKALNATEILALYNMGI